MQTRLPAFAADVLLVTATDVETSAVLSVFGSSARVDYQLVHVGNETYFDLGTISAARVLLVQSEMGATGPGASALTVTDSIRALSPSAVIMLGIAFGMNEERQELGQILVAQQLRDYECQRIGSSAGGRVKIIPRGARVESSPRLLKMLKAASQDWRGCSVDIGILLSGSKLIDNARFCDALRKLEPEALGGEMEGIGVYSAAYREHVDWILAKAICDWADGNKNEHKRERQELAAKNVAAFVLHVLRKGGFVQPTQALIEHDVASTSPAFAKRSRSDSPLPRKLPRRRTSDTPTPSSRTKPLPQGDTLQSPLDLGSHEDAVWAASFARLNGSLVAVTGGDDCTVRVWDICTPSPRAVLRDGDAAVWSLACTEIDGGSLAVTGGADGVVRVWDLPSSQIMHRIVGHVGRVGFTSCAPAASDVGPTGGVAALACTRLQGSVVVVSGNADGSVRLIDPVAGKYIRTLTGHLSPVWSVACTRLEGRAVAVTADAQSVVRVWDLSRGTTVQEFTDGGTAVSCFSVDQRPTAVTGDRAGRMRVWGLNDGTLLRSWTGHQDAVSAVSHTQIGDWPAAVTASFDGKARVWDLTHGTQLGVVTDGMCPIGTITCTNSDSRTLTLTGDKSGVVRLWNLAANSSAAKAGCVAWRSPS